jgi:hypothetical protein
MLTVKYTVGEGEATTMEIHRHTSEVFKNIASSATLRSLLKRC